ncbi:MAG: DEAD/DEAH box helicase, partial [Gammaproteobacteria bacterium]|nr:DEAD/DEAH box helicase [Gammaproteobacteria bacterium]
DLVVATPGRLLDFKRRRDVHLGHVEVLVIDEADRMLDMGFIPDVRNIIYSTPPKTQRQTLLFSATLTPDVTRLASQWTRDSVTIEIEPEQVAVDTVDQRIYITTTQSKFALLYNIIKRQEGQPVMVFGNRRDVTRRLTDTLADYGISCALLSGEVPQAKRMRTLEDFKQNKFQVLV